MLSARSSATGASRRELSKQFSQQGVPATIAASLHEASAQLQQDRHLPREGKLTGRGMVAGASAAGLGRLHLGSLPMQRSSSSAAPSMHDTPGMSRGLQQGGHSDKRQKTSDSEEEVVSLPAREACSTWPGQATALCDSVPAGADKLEQDFPKSSPGYREGAREAASTHRGSDSKQKGPGIPAEALCVKGISAASLTPPTVSLPCNGIEQKNLHVQKEASQMASPAESSALSTAEAPLAAVMSPQRMPQRYDPTLSILLEEIQHCMQLRFHSTAAA